MPLTRARRGAHGYGLRRQALRRACVHAAVTAKRRGCPRRQTGLDGGYSARPRVAKGGHHFFAAGFFADFFADFLAGFC